MVKTYTTQILNTFLLLLLLSRFSHVRLCMTPWMAAHPAPPSLGFSRQEHWSGLPFPSPMHESKKWKWSRSVVSDSSWSHGLQPTRLLCPWDFPSKSTGVGSHCLLCLLMALYLKGRPRDYIIKWNKSDRERQLSYDIVYIWNLKKNDINELIYKMEIDAQT